jgi:hypothetical protein
MSIVTLTLLSVTVEPGNFLARRDSPLREKQVFFNLTETTGRRKTI